MAAWSFYNENVRPLTLAAGLFPSRLARLGLEERDEEVFMARLNLIHDKTTEIEAEKARRKREE